jgi:hypothetical protein
MSGFRVVGDTEVVSEAEAPRQVGLQTPSPAQQQAAQATRLILTALAALSQRAVVALAALFSLALAASVFWLALTVSQTPTDRQIGVLALYAGFVLALHAVKRRP